MICNAVCHRNFLEPSNVQVALYDDRQDVGQGDGQGVGLDICQEHIKLHELILMLIKKDKNISKKEIAKIANVSEKTIERHMKKIPNVKYIGSGYSGYWSIDDEI